MPAQITAERDFFRQRSLYRNSDWCGLSSDAMLEQALTGVERPREYPRDKWDLGRCEETYRRAPRHLQERMLPTLELFRRMIGRDGMVDGLWCYECDHGGHKTTYLDLCRKHYEEAGLHVKS